MASMTAPPTRHRAADHAHPDAGRRAGYVVAVIVNGILLWVAHQLLDWGWPGFLTQDFDRLLPLLTVSFVVSMVVNTAYLARDRGRFRAFAEGFDAAIALVVSIQTWDVFPFDFTGYDHDWTWLARTLLVIAIVGTTIALVVHLVRLVRPPNGSIA